ncbi:MAG: thioredoxin [Lachnospiraceae bacterium]|nr:thioredoxin [Lachnospiraceae bacterium]
MVKYINTQNFESEVNSVSGVALVDFYADWCGPCKMVAPIVEEISNERDDVTVFKVNVDESPELASQFGVFSIPTLIGLKNGQETARIVGFRQKAAILAEILK